MIINKPTFFLVRLQENEMPEELPAAVETLEDLSKLDTGGTIYVQCSFKHKQRIVTIAQYKCASNVELDAKFTELQEKLTQLNQLLSRF